MTEVEVSDRARAIVDGLMRTGRGSERRVSGAYIRLRARLGEFYWIHVDGNKLLRGRDVVGAKPLQQGFTESMVRAGAPLPKR